MIKLVDAVVRRVIPLAVNNGTAAGGVLLRPFRPSFAQMLERGGGRKIRDCIILASVQVAMLARCCVWCARHNFGCG